MPGNEEKAAELAAKHLHSEVEAIAKFDTKHDGNIDLKKVERDLEIRENYLQRADTDKNRGGNGNNQLDRQEQKNWNDMVPHFTEATTMTYQTQGKDPNGKAYTGTTNLPVLDIKEQTQEDKLLREAINTLKAMGVTGEHGPVTLADIKNNLEGKSKPIDLAAAALPHR